MATSLKSFRLVNPIDLGNGLQVTLDMLPNGCTAELDELSDDDRNGPSGFSFIRVKDPSGTSTIVPLSNVACFTYHKH
jgi:hypothetical protein